MGRNASNHKTCSCDDPIGREQMLGQLDGIIDQHIGTEGALIPILQSAQRLFGYLPDTALRRISRRLGIPYSEVAGVVGFYSYFTTIPKGEYTIRVCLGTACYVRGGNDVLKALCEELKIDVGETTDDRKFSLEVGRCFGACGLAPVIMINDEVFQKVKPTKVVEIVNSYRN